MSKKKNTKKNFMPKFPALPAMPADFSWFGKKIDKEECKDKWGDFKSNVENFWDQMRDMQNSCMDASREQWNMFFGQFLDMQEIFIAALPDETPSWIPAFLVPVSPRAFMEKVKAFQEMANAHAVEQADSFLDFCKQGQQQVKEAVSEAVENAETKVKEAEEAAEKEAEEAEKEAEKPAKEEKPAKAAEEAPKTTKKSKAAATTEG